MEKERLTLTDQARRLLKGLIDPVAVFFNRLGVPPNTMTIVGLVGHAISSVFLAQGQMQWGAFFIIALGPVDALDGTMARLRGEASDWGAFVDSVVDRYSEVFLFGGLFWYYMQNQDYTACLLIYASVTGSILVSYVRARAQSLGLDVKIGLFTRMERYIVLVPALILGFIRPALWILAIGTHLTALQRIYSFRNRVRQK